MEHNTILEAALVERQEYLEELTKAQKMIELQVQAIQQDVDNLLLKIMKSS